MEGSSPILEHLQTREPLPLFIGFLKCIALVSWIYFTKYKFSAFYFTWVVLRKKKAYNKCWCKYYSQLFKSQTRRHLNKFSVLTEVCNLGELLKTYQVKMSHNSE